MFLGKEVKTLLKGQAKEQFIDLKKRVDKTSLSIMNSIERRIETIKTNPQHGDPIQKKKIPKIFQKQGIKNLYRCELSHYWRLIYTIQGSQGVIFVFILNILDHKQYDKLFKYRRR